MGGAENPLGEFINAVKNSPNLWQSVDVRMLAARVNGEWHNLLTRCYMDPRTPDAVVRLPDLPVVGDVGCWQHVVPVENLESLLTAVQQGELKLEGECVLYRAIREPARREPYRFDEYRFSDLSEWHRASYPYWSCHQLAGMGGSVHDVLREVPGGRFSLDNAIRTAPAPFDGLDGLARYAVGSSELLEPSRLLLFQVFAPLPVLLHTERCRFERGVLHYALRAGSRAAAQSTDLGIFAFGPSPVPHRSSVAVAHNRWTVAGGYWEVEGEVQLPGCQVATVIVRVGGYAVHRGSLIDVTAGVGNPRLESFRVFDPHLEVLRKSLLAEGSRGAARFESAVARLLALAGFQAIALGGDKRLQEGVDVIVHVPGTPVCIVVECTTGPLNSNEKLGKLVARVEAVRQACSQLEVQGLIVTSLKRVQVLQTDLDTAAEEELVVLCCEDLDELLALTVGGRSMTDLLLLLRSRVPPARET